MEAIILAGGLGSRLKSVVSDRPKALSEVAGKPFLHFIIEYLQKQGVSKFIFSLGYLADQIVDFLEKNYPNLQYSYFIEETPLGTGGGIKKSIQLATTQDVLIVNADTYFDISLPEMFEFHKTNQASCTIALKPMEHFDRYGSVELDEKNSIISFKEKQFTEKGLINGGYLIIDKTFFLANTKHLPDIFSFEKEFIEPNLDRTLLQGFISNGYFIDIGIPEDYSKAQHVFSNNALIN